MKAGSKTAAHVCAMAGIAVALVCLQACPSKIGGAGGGSGAGGGVGGSGGADASADHPAAMCTGCRSNQVCVGGACVDVPSACPCPKETYCDLAKSTCVVGCTSDDQCDTGRICLTDQRQCRAGCRDDSVCGSGTICVNTMCTPGCRADSACGAEQICTQMQCQAGCHDDTGCNAQRICDQGLCRTGCRADTGCGTAQVCDATTLTCRAGCRADSGCGLAQVCDTTLAMCVAGCRSDAGCPAGQLCDAGTLVCRAGCRMSASCPMEQYCNTTSLTCVSGCDDDTRCNPGRICTSKVCVDGCRTDATCPTGMRCFSNICRSYCNSDSDCPLGQVCNTSMQQCVAGCGLPGKVMTGDEYLRCPIGQACQQSGCSATTNVCSKYTCTGRCNGVSPYDATMLGEFTCHTSAAHPYTCWGLLGQRFCAESCNLTDRPTTCQAAGASCELIWDAVSGDPSTPICVVGAVPCKNDQSCAVMHVDGTSQAQNCICQMADLPDAPAGTCRYPTATQGAAICAFMESWN